VDKAPADTMDDLSALQNALASWDRLSLLAAGFVLAGAILVSLMQFESLARWSGLERVPRLQWPLGKLGVLLIIVGLTGEIACVTKSRNFADHIAAVLNARGAAAIERAHALERDAAELRLQLARLKWRVITPDQQAALTDMLKQAPRGPVLVLHGPDDEPSSYAVQIGDALKAAGFAARVQQGPAALNLPGTWLLVRDLQNPPAHAIAIQKAFRELHVELDGQQDTQYVPDATTVVLVIGARRF
jgi:hypothetical protein